MVAPKKKKGKAGAPKGNKNAVGYGAPTIYTKEKIEELAKDFIEYANDEKNLIFREWCCNHMRGAELISELVNMEKKYNIDCFYKAQRFARAKIGARRERLAGQKFGGIDAGIAKASMATYDLEHRAVLIELKTAEREAKVNVMSDAMNKSKKFLDAEIAKKKKKPVKKRVVKKKVKK